MWWLLSIVDVVKFLTDHLHKAALFYFPTAVIFPFQSVWFSWISLVSMWMWCQSRYSLGPMCHALYLWSMAEEEGFRIGARSEKNEAVWFVFLEIMSELWNCWNISGVISVFAQGSLIQYRNQWLKHPFLNFGPIWVHSSFLTGSLQNLCITGDLYFVLLHPNKFFFFFFSSQVLYLKERWTWTSVQML